jgi:hypothetical protein
MPLLRLLPLLLLLRHTTYEDVIGYYSDECQFNISS